MKPIRDMTAAELRELSDTEMRGLLRHDMLELLAMTHTDYAEARRAVRHRLGLTDS